MTISVNISGIYEVDTQIKTSIQMDARVLDVGVQLMGQALIQYIEKAIS